MQETMTQVSTQVTEKWETLSKEQKTKMGIGIGAIIMAVVLCVLMISKPKMQVLYRNLDLKDAAEVAQILDTEKINYSVIDDGRTIQVEGKDLNAAKLILARENVPKSKYTFDDAITNSMSTTEQEKQAKMDEYKKAEIEKALESMDAINKANVTLEIPQEKNSFLASKEKSSASVMLTLNNSLSSKQVEGIARFISSSVEKLDMENITIIDTEGNNLYMGESEGEFSLSKQQELKVSAEQGIRSKIIDLLAPLYDEVRISPNLILDFSQHEEVREEYIPSQEGENRGIIQSESSVTSSSTNMQNGYEPGVTSNGGDAPTYQVGTTNGGESKTTSKDIQYANNKVVSNSVKNVGDIDYQNSSVAVHVFKNKIYSQELIESTLPSTSSWEIFKEENKYQVPMTVDPTVAESIQKGTGIENIVVYGYENPVFIDKVPYEISSKDYIPYILLVGVLLIGAFGLFKFRKPAGEIETEPELQVEEMLKITKEEIELEDIQLKDNLETKRRIEKFVDEKPEAVANLLRNWLTEEDWE